MDCGYMLAEELAREGAFHEAFAVAFPVLREERREPYFRHFAIEVETFLKELVRLNLRGAVDNQVWIECLRLMLTLNFPPKDQVRYLLSLTAALDTAGDRAAAQAAFNQARRLDPSVRRPHVRIRQEASLH
jgi:hypothetical protein